MECGALLVREGALLRRAFEIVPDYLKDAAVEAGEVNFSDMGLQLTRGWRALKIWLSSRRSGSMRSSAPSTRLWTSLVLLSGSLRSGPRSS